MNRSKPFDSLARSGSSMVRQILDHLATDEGSQWKRIRKEIQWTIFWPLTKAVVLFWLIYVALWLIGGQ